MSPRTQPDLFGEGPAAPVDAAPDLGRYEPLAKRIPNGILLGTSSWSFPGWKGIVYDREVSATVLARHGVRAYARHPLLRCVGVDRSYYAPLSPGDLEDLRAHTPPSFRFVLKADRRLVFPGGPGSDPDIFLNPVWATAEVVQPTREILGERLGTILFQFPPVSPASLGGPRRFAERLYRFLSRLPAWAPATVEIRTPALLTPDYAAALHHSGARHGFVVHPEMTDLDTQRAVVGLAAGGSIPTRGSTPTPGPTLIRWMLKPGRSYEGARAAWSPFDRLASPDPERRAAVVELARAAAESGGAVMVVVNNKAEGSSPLSVIELARALAEPRDATL